MAKLRIIDRKDKFLVEVDGSKIPYVTTYEVIRKPCGSVLLNLALAMREVEVEIESDNIGCNEPTKNSRHKEEHTNKPPNIA